MQCYSALAPSWAVFCGVEEGAIGLPLERRRCRIGAEHTCRVSTDARRNLAGDPAHKEVVAKMRKQLVELLKESGDPELELFR